MVEVVATTETKKSQKFSPRDAPGYLRHLNVCIISIKDYTSASVIAFYLNPHKDAGLYQNEGYMINIFVRFSANRGSMVLL